MIQAIGQAALGEADVPAAVVEAGAARTIELALQRSGGVHELTHQWFGDSLRVAAWQHIWLNEGFASWMAAKATAHFHPEWRPYLDGIVERESVLNLDARKTTHPIQTRIDNEEQAAGAFDAITYVKGQGFLRMLESWVGEDAFRKGIRTYMARHQYSNTTTADLWAAIEQYASRDRRYGGAVDTPQPAPSSGAPDSASVADGGA